MDENDALRAALHQQVDFAHSLVRVVSKRPRSLYSTSPVEGWRLLMLPMSIPDREAAMHAITERELEQLHGAYVTAGLIDPTTEFQRNEARYENGGLVVDTTAFLHLPCPFDIAVRAGWDVIRGVSDVKPVIGIYQTLADVDGDTAYFSSLHKPIGAERRLVVKRFFRPHVVSYVARSIAADELFPLDPALAVMDEVAWAQVVEDPETGAVTLKYCQKVHPPLAIFAAAEGPVTMHLMLLFQKITKSYERAIRAQIQKYMAEL
ncbi:hypothetical protein ACHHYP_15702 [Achlya hypogyna]|uniref:START domain-containing protein n=1 Tax=Achlya hypogyna TaxID=1202772 RepID=A0A1V9YA66_ACHHY|nr:hypothetical protein ACHHYP_15702 [Achlya hypogyna]